jgi:DNA-binding NarL/FixJ family response regulator
MRGSSSFLLSRTNGCKSAKPWTSEELAVLRELAHRGVPVPSIARQLRRSQSAIKNKAFMHGISLRNRTEEPAAATAIVGASVRDQALRPTP